MLSVYHSDSSIQIILECYSNPVYMMIVTGPDPSLHLQCWMFPYLTFRICGWNVNCPMFLHTIWRTPGSQVRILISSVKLSF